MTSRAVLLAVLALSAAAAPAASAADCPAGAQCGRVTVPLDHSGRTPGTLQLAYAKLPATGTRSGTLVLLTGGPGQAAVPLTTNFAKLITPLRASYDVVAVDQRGSGASGAVDCSFDAPSDITDCATKLGDKRAFFSTPETARDLDDLRAALGVDKLSLYGVSYGASIAAAYARLFPARTAAVVLDSPTPVDGLDGVDQLRTFGTPRVLREVCYPGLCHATVSDPDAALEKAIARLKQGALRGPLVDAAGRVKREKVTQSALYSLISASDLLPALRAGLPAAIASLAEGDAAPLLHLAAVVAPTTGGGSSDVNSARLLATTCMESRLPWAPDSPVASRSDALKAFAAARADAFAPFSPSVVLDNAATSLCATWPPTPRPEALPYGGPDVPVLVISGRQDLRTPTESAHRTAAQYPHAILLRVASAGHSVLSTDVSGCARAGMMAFLRGQAVQQCNKAKQDRFTMLAAPYAPATIDTLRPIRLPGRPGRTLSALTVTLTGVGFDTATRTGSFRLPGLRAGFVRGRGSRLELHGVSWIDGVRVSGTISGRAGGTLTLSGPAAAAGSVTYSRQGVAGTLGGVPFSVR